ncbi:glutathione-independent glyoxalase DJR-1.1 [Favolaschia claudopus]|uniref:D-lactate dehydratase n=1 Tax=Favolaschia claudopus TaxID=2862362 RepID=A0AAW0EEU8_9AGAR
MPSAVVLLADGTEEMEFTITFDTLVRAGVKCCSAYVPPQTDVNPPPYATGSRGIRIMYDEVFDAARFSPPRVRKTMSNSAGVQDLVREFLAQGKIVGMICAGSLTALTSKLPRQPLTSHPSVKTQLENDYDYSEDSVVISNKLVTSRGPGTAFPFALTLVELLCGAEKRDEVRAPMVFPSGTPF